MAEVSRISNRLETTGVYAGAAASVVSGIGLTLILMYYRAQIPIVACSTLSGVGLVTFCFSLVKKMTAAREMQKETRIQALLKGVIDDILKEYPQYQQALKNDGPAPFTPAKNLSLKDSFELLLVIAQKLADKKEKEEGFQIIASAVTLAGFILLEPHEGEKIQDEVLINDRLCNPFEILVKTQDKLLLGTLFSLIQNEILIFKFLWAINNFGTDEIASLLIKKLDSADFDISKINEEFIKNYVFYGWQATFRALILDDHWRQNPKIFDEAIEAGEQSKQRLLAGGLRTPTEIQKHWASQILKADYGSMRKIRAKIHLSREGG